MDSHGYTHAYPHLGDMPMPEKPAWNINAGYVQRAAHVLPKSGTHRPWNVRHNYVLDAIDHRFDRIEESMVFGRRGYGVRRRPAPCRVATSRIACSTSAWASTRSRTAALVRPFGEARSSRRRGRRSPAAMAVPA